MSSKLTNFQKKELKRLFSESIDPFFTAFELLNTKATKQIPTVALLYILWEHLAWLLCGDSKTQVDDTGKAFIRFGEKFLSVQDDFAEMLNRTELTLESLWAERNKQLHTGRMIPDKYDKTRPERRPIFYGDHNDSYAAYIERMVYARRKKGTSEGYIYMNIFIKSLRTAADELLTHLLANHSQGMIAFKRLLLRGSKTVGDILRKASLPDYERLRFCHNNGRNADVFPQNDGVRLVFNGKDAVVLSPAQLRDFAGWADENMRAAPEWFIRAAQVIFPSPH